MFEFTLDGSSDGARAGTLVLPHGIVQTPCFMPVGTHGTVRGLHPAEVERTGTQIILGNTYHLHLRPGEETIAALGGLHRFSTWSKPMLTDSGGFQVFSLSGLKRLDENGVEFTSHIDGSRRRLTPESAMEIQWALAADVAMAFDHLLPGQSSHADAIDAMERTLRWLDRCKLRHAELSAESPLRQTLWPIVQGGVHADLRARSLAGILERDPWTGVAIGGLSVGEPKPAMHKVLEDLAPHLPVERPRYLMGVGFPDDLVEGIARGVDLFDCVAATRNGRHGSAWTTVGQVQVRAATNRVSDLPLDPGCDCECCTRFSRGYLRHLFVVEEQLGQRLVSLHNIRFLVRLAEAARARVLDGTFSRWAAEWRTRYFSKGIS
ncbi:MAG: tRNA guanosine(34) transglycosylase Tgt [Gemmatimonadales bacterium]|nr:tRNA guanosine(34) transglycosylase Tgt [Gemmatimonadales bacterium]MDZ4390726.1 tRNA guanosine(34) transglycosylase Tgt [Gemmatimonadales bacterium]